MSLSDWTASHPGHLLTILAVYLVLVVYLLPGRYHYQHSLLPQWYRFNGILSLGLFLCLLPEFLFTTTYGWSTTVCSKGNLYNGFLSGGAMALFLYSKFLDLFETVLIVLEKRKPLLIHLVHHFCTLLFVWICFSKQTSLLRPIAIANLAAHVLLYSYLTPYKFGIHPCYMSVALSQMLQFAICIWACVTARKELEAGRPCQVSPSWSLITLIGLIAFFFLFADFYHQKYVKFRIERNCVGRHSSRENFAIRRSELRSEPRDESNSDKSTKEKSLNKDPSAKSYTEKTETEKSRARVPSKKARKRRCY